MGIVLLYIILAVLYCKMEQDRYNKQLEYDWLNKHKSEGDFTYYAL